MQPLKAISENNVKRYNVSKNSSNNVKRSNVTGVQVHHIASDLCDKFGDTGRKDYQFFCKIAWVVPEYLIRNHFEAAQKGRQPIRLFTYLCGLELQKLSQ